MVARVRGVSVLPGAARQLCERRGGADVAGAAVMMGLVKREQAAGPDRTSIAEASPLLAGQWHPWLNRGRSPASTRVSLSRPVWWLGACGHEWQESPSRRFRKGVGCPVCSGERTRPGVNDLATTDPVLAARWSRGGGRYNWFGLSSRDVNIRSRQVARMIADAADDPHDGGADVEGVHPGQSSKGSGGS